ncbi:hypothetical protein IE077_002722 [Cardiosporidium cionae]|uniref:Uncharacterized protein n=1 Tax=Cardiosporidium cionae TaxID=476202 RepID=A0ABQ7JA68_9APIC|nr:hypothetical protein IE077_002722 [Cardiosporidium cionae]|eukprot:KAF8820876.1 hypothetical protein IE077_002722 [Cardiosporidium cionae]
MVYEIVEKSIGLNVCLFQECFLVVKMDLRDDLHSAIDMHIEQLMVSYLNILENATIETVDCIHRKIFINNFQLKLHVHGLLHSCRSLVQLAADLTVNGLVHSIPEQLEEQERLKLEIEKSLHALEEEVQQSLSCESK